MDGTVYPARLHYDRAGRLHGWVWHPLCRGLYQRPCHYGIEQPAMAVVHSHLLFYDRRLCDDLAHPSVYSATVVITRCRNQISNLKSQISNIKSYMSVKEKTSNASLFKSELIYT